jgi:hypothetical protein
MCHHGVGMDPCGLGPTFELSVPSDRGDLFPPANLEEIGSGTALRLTGGTNSSNPVSSSGESGANLNLPAGTSRSSAEAGPGAILPQGDRGFESRRR